MNKKEQLLKEDQMIKSYIKRLVRESLESMASNYQYEEKSDDNNPGPSREQEKDDNRRAIETEKGKRRRVQVEKFLKQDSINPAEYFYKLFGVKDDGSGDNEEKKNARSLGYKKRDHELNDDGYPYTFTSEEINKLYSMISGNGLS